MDFRFTAEVSVCLLLLARIFGIFPKDPLWIAFEVVLHIFGLKFIMFKQPLKDSPNQNSPTQSLPQKGSSTTKNPKSVSFRTEEPKSEFTEKPSLNLNPLLPKSQMRSFEQKKQELLQVVRQEKPVPQKLKNYNQQINFEEIKQTTTKMISEFKQELKGSFDTQRTTSYKSLKAKQFQELKKKVLEAQDSEPVIDIEEPLKTKQNIQSSGKKVKANSPESKTQIFGTVQPSFETPQRSAPFELLQPSMPFEPPQLSTYFQPPQPSMSFEPPQPPQLVQSFSFNPAPSFQNFPSHPLPEEPKQSFPNPFQNYKPSDTEPYQNLFKPQTAPSSKPNLSQFDLSHIIPEKTPGKRMNPNNFYFNNYENKLQEYKEAKTYIQEDYLLTTFKKEITQLFRAIDTKLTEDKLKELLQRARSSFSKIKAEKIPNALICLSSTAVKLFLNQCTTLKNSIALSKNYTMFISNLSSSYGHLLEKVYLEIYSKAGIFIPEYLSPQKVESNINYEDLKSVYYAKEAQMILNSNLNKTRYLGMLFAELHKTRSLDKLCEWVSKVVQTENHLVDRSYIPAVLGVLCVSALEIKNKYSIQFQVLVEEFAKDKLGFLETKFSTPDYKLFLDELKHFIFTLQDNKF